MLCAVLAPVFSGALFLIDSSGHRALAALGAFDRRQMLAWCCDIDQRRGGPYLAAIDVYLNLMVHTKRHSEPLPGCRDAREREQSECRLDLGGRGRPS